MLFLAWTIRAGFVTLAGTLTATDARLLPGLAIVFGIDKLHVHSKPIAAPLQRAFEHVPDVQLVTDLFEINRLAFVGECGMSADRE